MDPLPYYESRAIEFAENTFALDMSSLYAPFLGELPSGGRILDAGCGSGRDALAFAELGFDVEAFDASSALVDWARKKTGLPIELCTFADYSRSKRFDGIWACASLLHLELQDAKQAIAKLFGMLRENGVLYASFKLGHGVRIDGERQFLDLHEEDLPALIDACGKPEVFRVWRTHDSRPGREAEEWINFLLRRTDTSVD